MSRPGGTRVVLAALATALVAALLGPAAAAREPAGTYVNPVSRAFADTFADPSVIRGKDGWWYAVGTSDPLREGERSRHLLPVSRSRDLVSWTFVGDAMTSLPSWAAPDASLWAPDIRYVDGAYRMYYVVTSTTVTAEPNDNAVGVATAPTPAGPWTDAGAPVVGPRRGNSGNPGDFLWTFDPSHVTDVDGTQHLLYGSYYGGIWLTALDATGTRAVGTPTRIAIDNRFEGGYVVRRDGWWYLFASSADCCAGPTTGYSVYAGRSRDLRGPYADREGVPLDTSRAGGTIVVAPNGNRWVGTGHNAVVTDLAGQDWLAYHAIDRDDPYLDEPFRINERPMLLDRLDWIGGWPTVRAGAWASDTPQSAPVTAGPAVSDLSAGAADGWRVTGTWRPGEDAQGGGYLSAAACDAAALVTRGAAPADVRVEADVRLPRGADGIGAAGPVAAFRGAGDHVAARIDARARALVLRVRRAGATVLERTAPLPSAFAYDTWHSVVLEVRGRSVTAELSGARLGDPLATVGAALPPGAARSGPAGILAPCGPADVDNLSAVRASRPVARSEPVSPPGRLDPSRTDEFDGGTLRPGWTWVRQPQGAVSGGVLRWPTQDAELNRETNTASVLLREPPAGDWTAETRLTIDLGTDTVRNFQQAGLIAYAGDDLYTKLVHVAIWNTRQTEFGKEMPFAGRIAYGGTIVGPPAPTTYLRLTHRTDPRNGEHELRASTSRDGRTWTHGGVWTLPAGAPVRVGLISMGGAGAVADFDYVRFYER